MSLFVPVLDVNPLLLHGSNDVDYAEVVAVFHSDVLCVIVPWKDEGSLTIYHKKYVVYGLIFYEDVLVFRVELRFEQGAHPQNEGQLPIFEELNLVVPLFININ